MMRFLGTFVVIVASTSGATGQPPDGGEYGPPPGVVGGPSPNAVPSHAVPTNAMFNVIDADGDGVITTRELRKAVAALKQLDVDKDGKITREESSAGPREGFPGEPGAPGGNPSAMIDRMMENDKNGDGKLTKNELPRHMAQMLDGADTNGDNAIDRAELVAAMQNAGNQFGGGQRVFGGPGGSFNGGASGDPRPTAGNLMQYDRNGDGVLSADEVPAQMQGMLRGSDQNGDGRLDAAEVQAIQQRMTERLRGQRPLPPGISVGPEGVQRTPQRP